LRWNLLELKQDTFELAAELKANGVPLYCLSDMPKNLRAIQQGLHVPGPVRRTRNILAREDDEAGPRIFKHLLDTFRSMHRRRYLSTTFEKNIQTAESSALRALFSRAPR